MESSSAGRSEVVVVDVQMPFMSMVTFMVKWTLASIPAFIILFILFTVLGAIVAGIFAGMFAGLAR